jgi:sarcosine oxidase subunit beta
VVIIGAGIQGLSAAYHLAKAGISDVAVVEKAFIGAGSSGQSASMLMKQVWTAHQVAFSQYCFGRYMDFEEELGRDPDYKRIGSLCIATESVADASLAQAQMRQAAGVETEILSPEEVQRRCPEINVEDVAAGIWGPEDGIIEAQSIMLGYKDGAVRLGASVYQGVQATGIILDGEQVSGAETTAGAISTGWVVNAAGADAAEVGSWVGLELPIDNRARCIYVTDAFPQIPDDTPFVYDDEHHWYYRKEPPGVLMGMGKLEGKQASSIPDWTYLPEVIDIAVHRVPALEQAGIAYGWVGIRPLTPDNRPILGPVEGISGYVNSCGWGGEGVMHAPIGGQLVAEFIRDGVTGTYDLEPFLYERFRAGD